MGRNYLLGSAYYSLLPCQFRFRILSQNRERVLCRRHPLAGVRATPSARAYSASPMALQRLSLTSHLAHPFGIDWQCLYPSTLCSCLSRRFHLCRHPLPSILMLLSSAPFVPVAIFFCSKKYMLPRPLNGLDNWNFQSSEGFRTSPASVVFSKASAA